MQEVLRYHLVVGSVLGALQRAPEAGTETYRAMSGRPVLGQKFEDDLTRTYTGRQPGELPAFFANLLPHDKLRAVVERSLKLDAPTDLELLAAVGTDLPGAVRLDPVNLELADVETSSDREPHEPTSDDGLGLRFSLAGVQMKFSVLRDADRFTIPAHGNAGNWIVKVALREYEGLAENEYATLEWARAAGFDVPDCSLVKMSELAELQKYTDADVSALVIQRYDRHDGRPIHQEDFAQVIGRQPQKDGSEKYGFTYEALGLLIKTIIDSNAFDEYVRRLVFVIASGNNDAHLKNWSLLYPDRVRPVLAPLYDQLATVAWPTLDRKLALKLSGGRDFGPTDLNAFSRLARTAQAEEQHVLQNVQETLQRIREAWPRATESGLPATHANAVRQNWSRVPLLRDHGSLPD
jgi:serine/threonine-protein kinase HipA